MDEKSKEPAVIQSNHEPSESKRLTSSRHSSQAVIEAICSDVENVFEESTGLSPKKLEAVFYYIDNNIDATITVKDLAQAAMMSEFHFSRLFKKKVGETPLQYVNNRRIAIAKSLLDRTSKSIVWIAYEPGFKGASYFCSKFKSSVGITPKEYCKARRAFA